MKAIARATLVAGTLDILSAIAFAGMAGMGPVALLQFVASGPFGDQAKSGGGWALAGLLVHFAIMACMVAAYYLAARRWPALNRRPLWSGALYGVLLWFIMYWIVRPLRWPAMALPAAWAGMPVEKVAWSIGNALFSHCLLVGIPIALMTARALRGPSG